MPPELPPTPERQPEKSLEELSRELAAKLLEGDFSELVLSDEEMEALTNWQTTAEKEAEKENTSVANIEVMVRRAEIFIEAGRYTFAQYDLEDALLAAENDLSVPPELIGKIKSLQQGIATPKA